MIPFDMLKTGWLYRTRGTALALAALYGLAACSDSSDRNRNATPAFSFPTPTVAEIAIEGTSEPWMPSNGLDLEALGYRQAEYAVTGTANSYSSDQELSADGRWEVEAADQADYVTRLLVYRPAGPADFNGTLVVEWLNVSGGTDAAPLWSNLHTEMIRRGYA